MKPPRISFEDTWQHRVLGLGTSREQAAIIFTVMVGFAAVGAAAWQTRVLGSEQERLQAAIERAQFPVVRRAPRHARPVTSAPILQQMDATTARLNVPWSAVLDAIERCTTDDVALLTLETDSRTGSVALTAEARSLEDLLTYAEALGKDAAIASVRINQHDVRVQEPEQPVRKRHRVD